MFKIVTKLHNVFHVIILFKAKHVQPAAGTSQQEKEKAEEPPIQQQLENVVGEF